jgi:hypothetical protein
MGVSRRVKPPEIVSNAAPERVRWLKPPPSVWPGLNSNPSRGLESRSGSYFITDSYGYIYLLHMKLQECKNKSQLFVFLDLQNSS